MTEMLFLLPRKKRNKTDDCTSCLYYDNFFTNKTFGSDTGMCSFILDFVQGNSKCEHYKFEE